VLLHLMESRDMSRAQLGEILSSRSAATVILNSRREMSNAHIRAIVEFFAVSPAVLI
jgi:antitoxin component HigA of HigAB toxin-antitoxin module